MPNQWIYRGALGRRCQHLAPFRGASSGKGGSCGRGAARPMVDGIQKQRSKRHGTAVKKGIKKAKARKKVVKQATLALRKAPSKQAIVQRLFTPTSPREAAAKQAD